MPFQQICKPLFAAALLYLAASPLTSAAEAEAPPTSAAEVAPTLPPEPHIALILPSKAGKSMAAAAEAVRQGVLSGEARLGDGKAPPIRLYPVSERDEEVSPAFEMALAQGAVSVIGPLTRGGIAQLAQRSALPIPVLALNTLDDRPELAQLYTIGLSLEGETRQVVQRMRLERVAKPLLIETEGPLARRIRDAFLAEWKSFDGAEPVVISTSTQKEALSKLRESAAQSGTDAVFLAADAAKARLLRPYLGNERTVYATSKVWGGRTGRSPGNIDLLGVRFADIPWLLDPWQADIALYKRSNKPLEADLERLYALGIDAYRLSLLLQLSGPDATLEVQGVTGILKLSQGKRFSRELSHGEVGAEPLTPAPQPETPIDPATGQPLPAATPSSTATPPAPAKPAAPAKTPA